MCQKLEKIFNEKLKSLPLPEYVVEHIPATKKRQSIPMASPAFTPTMAARPSRRSSTRPVRAPSKDLPDSSSPGGRRLSPRMRYCQTVLKELLSKRYAHFAWPFYEPVDVSRLGLKDYLDIIKKPMDLGTVNRKLSNGEYASYEEFTSDVTLIFQNCYKYNPPDHDVVGYCKQLQEVFEVQMAGLPDEDPNFNQSSSESSEDEQPAMMGMDARTRQIQELQQTLLQASQALASLTGAAPLGAVPVAAPKSKSKKKKKRSKTTSSSSRRSVAPTPAPAPRRSAPSQRKRKPPRQQQLSDSSSESEDEDMTYDQKHALSQNINKVRHYCDAFF